jgi:hypothetical protein
VALSVIGDVDEQSSHRRGHSFSSYRSRSFQICIGQRSHASRPIRDGRTQFRKQPFAGRIRIEFGSQQIQLPSAEVSGFGVSQQTIQTSCQMPYVERDGSGSRRPHIHFVVGKTAAPLLQVFIRELQRVENRAPDRGNIGLSTA